MPTSSCVVESDAMLSAISEHGSQSWKVTMTAGNEHNSSWERDPSILLPRATGCVFGRSGGRPFCDVIVDERELRVTFASEAEAASFRDAARAAGVPVEAERHLSRLLSVTLGGTLLLLAIAYFVLR